MKCKTCRRLIVLDLYGELGPADRRRLERHLDECAECARDLEYTRGVFDMIDRSDSGSLPEADWDGCWFRITDGIRGPGRARVHRPKIPRWVTAAAAAGLVFAVGIFLGRFWRPSAPQAAPTSAGSAAGFDPIDLQGYFESLKPILVEYVNLPSDAPADERVPVDRRLIHSLLVQNFMLMRAVAENDPAAAELLEDIDLVLREIKNLGSGDPDAPAMIRSLIRQRNILFKIDIMKKL
jgi:hypothetical protein